MKRILLILCFITSIIPKSYGQLYYWPFEPGDRVVLDNNLFWYQIIPDKSVFGFIDSDIAEYIGIRKGPGATVPYDGLIDTGSRNFTIFTAGLTYKGMFAALYMDGYTELYPMSPPHTDTLWLYQHFVDKDSIRWRYGVNVRQFDTTISNVIIRTNVNDPIDLRTPAFSIDLYDTAHVFLKRITMAVHFWTINVEYPDGTSYPLNGYKSAFLSKGLGPYAMHYPVLCPQRSITYKYLAYHGWPTHESSVSYSTFSLQDTSINDTTYYLIHNPDNTWIYPIPNTENPIRNDGEDLMERVDGIEVRHPVPYAFLGDSYWEGDIIQVDTIEYFGKRVSLSFYSDRSGMDGPTISGSYRCGIGLWEKDKYSFMFGSQYNYTVHSSEFCPDSLLFVEDFIHSSLPRWEVETYPSPATEYVTIAVTSAATAAPVSGTVQIFDVLGHTVLTYAWDSITQGSALTIPIPGFAPGVYFYRLMGNHAWLGGQFTVVR